MVTRYVALVITLALASTGAIAACSSSDASTPSTGDAGDDDSGGNSGGPDAADSICGHPGDKGNALGVGKFCQFSSDCTDNTRATLCAIIGDDHAFFCTFLCDKDGSADQCGEGAHCTDQGGPSGCFPDSCDDRPDAAADAGVDAPADSPAE